MYSVDAFNDLNGKIVTGLQSSARRGCTDGYSTSGNKEGGEDEEELHCLDGFFWLDDPLFK
jgi:hypothetical protein